jgi:AbrB family looped-hinge helix DNA binding protein
MIVQRKIGPKGQVVIPKDIRILLGLKEGSIINFEVVGDKVFINASLTPSKFIEEFIKTPKKMKEKIDIKKQLSEQYE